MKEEKREEGGVIVVLDEGIRAGHIDDPSPQWICCVAAFSPLRW